MPTTIAKTCRTCRFVFDFPTNCATFACPACGTVNGRPQVEGSALEGLARATRQRLACDFHNAVNSYQHVLLDSPEEHEALWGLALCRYGVEYVDDPRTGKRMPTVHTVRRKPMQLDPDYLAAIDCAPEDVRTQYEQEAQYIDDAMARIIERSEQCPPYDVFLCHKTTKPGTEAYTEDYNRAFDLYHELTMQGYRVFFAPKEMAGVAAGSDYEAAIYHALDTAKVMLLICSDAEYLTSAWVRSEWTRFLEMADEKQGKCLLPLMYGGFAAREYPRELRVRRIEGVRMEALNSWENVQQTIRGYVRKETKQETVLISQPPEPETAPAILYAPESDFGTETVDGGVSITGYTGAGGEVNIPPTILGMKVVAIGERAFEGCDSLTSVNIPDGVTSIGECAFEECSSLTSVTLPDGVTSIGDYAFSVCRSLTSITLPDSVTCIGDFTFDGCSNLTSITLPGGVTSIGGFAFNGCSSLMSITLPDSVTSIEDGAFYGCSNLTSITLPDSLTSIMDFAFSHCSSLTSITLPDSVTSIESYAFENCSSLTSVTLPPRVKLGACVFLGCPWRPPR